MPEHLSTIIGPDLDKHAVLVAMLSLRDAANGEPPTWEAATRAFITAYLNETGLRDKADQWDAAQPLIEAMTAVVEAAREVHNGAIPLRGRDTPDGRLVAALERLDGIISGANPQKGSE